MTISQIIVKKILTDEEINNKEGTYYDEEHFKYIITDDTDVYKENGELLLKFRKNVIPIQLTNNALNSYRKVAKIKKNNRGAAAGVLDSEKLPKYVKQICNDSTKKKKKKYSSHYITKNGEISKTVTTNLAASNIIGFYDKPDRNINKDGKAPKCRQTAFTRDNELLWNKTLPFIEHIDKLFKKLIPDKHLLQYNQSQKTPKFVINNTCFSTLTVNYSWRTAVHKDSGDFKDGFGNLIVIEDIENPNTYQGSYTGFPQYGVCVDIRTGDFLAMDVHEWHCNTEFKNDNQEINENFNRLSIVCYLRNKMIQCKDL